MTGGWASYSWPPAIVLVSVTVIFLFDFFAERYVEKTYGVHAGQNIESLVTSNGAGSGTQCPSICGRDEVNQADTKSAVDKFSDVESLQELEELAFRKQIAAFLTLEFGVIFHSVIIGMHGTILRRISVEC